MKKALLFIKERKKSFFAALFAILALFGMTVPGPQQDFVIEIFDSFVAEETVTE